MGLSVQKYEIDIYSIYIIIPQRISYPFSFKLVFVSLVSVLLRFFCTDTFTHLFSTTNLEVPQRQEQCLIYLLSLAPNTGPGPLGKFSIKDWIDDNIIGLCSEGETDL